MNSLFSRQQSLFHVLAAYSIYNTVSGDPPLSELDSEELEELRGAPGLWGSFQGSSATPGLRAELICRWEGGTTACSESLVSPLALGCFVVR